MMPRRRGTYHRPKPNRRRALELLASCRDGCTEAIMFAHGFTVAQLADLVGARLATASAERVVAGLAQDRGCARPGSRWRAAAALLH
jgi:hypothetical protein